MKTYGIVLLLSAAVALGVVGSKGMYDGGRERRVAQSLGEVSGKLVELENKLNEMVAVQIKSSENNRQVYGAVARLCTIFEGILQINQKNEASPVSAQEKTVK